MVPRVIHGYLGNHRKDYFTQAFIPTPGGFWVKPPFDIYVEISHCTLFWISQSEHMDIMKLILES